VFGGKKRKRPPRLERVQARKSKDLLASSECRRERVKTSSPSSECRREREKVLSASRGEEMYTLGRLRH